MPLCDPAASRRQRRRTNGQLRRRGGQNRGGNVAAARTTERHLSDEDLARVIGLIKQSDTVELKVTVRQGDHISGVAALGMDPLDAQIRQVYFFDTPALTLYHHGVVVRARRVQKKGDDSVVKLRPVVPSELPDAV